MLIVDLSHYDEVESFEKIALEAQGAILKATEGLTDVDHTYAGRMAEAKAAGLKVGAYHFLRPEPVTEQATFFLQNAQLTPDMIAVLDWEVTTVTISEVLAWAATITGHRNEVPWLYGPADMLIEMTHWITAAEHEALAKMPLWLADFNPTPNWPKHIWPEYRLWQYTENGRINGVKGRVDLSKGSWT